MATKAGQEPPLGARPMEAGRGKLTYDNGDTYDGDVVNNLRHGKGTHRCSSGDSYDVSKRPQASDQAKRSRETRSPSRAASQGSAREGAHPQGAHPHARARLPPPTLPRMH